MNLVIPIPETRIAPGIFLARGDAEAPPGASTPLRTGSSAEVWGGGVGTIGGEGVWGCGGPETGLIYIYTYIYIHMT